MPLLFEHPMATAFELARDLVLEHPIWVTAHGATPVDLIGAMRAYVWMVGAVPSCSNQRLAHGRTSYLGARYFGPVRFDDRGALQRFSLFDYVCSRSIFGVPTALRRFADRRHDPNRGTRCVFD